MKTYQDIVNELNKSGYIYVSLRKIYSLSDSPTMAVKIGFRDVFVRLGNVPQNEEEFLLEVNKLIFILEDPRYRSATFGNFDGPRVVTTETAYKVSEEYYRMIANIHDETFGQTMARIVVEDDTK